MASFAVKFLGCKVSQADAMIARRALLAAGHTEVSEDEAELHVITTCCITSEAEAKSRQAVRRSLKAADRVFVAGCAVNLNGAQFRGIDDRVSAYVGTAEEVAGAMVAGLGACADLSTTSSPAPRPDRPANRVPPGPHPRLHQGPGRLRLPLRVLRTIPTVRGDARSRPAWAVLTEARRGSSRASRRWC